MIRGRYVKDRVRQIADQMMKQLSPTDPARDVPALGSVGKMSYRNICRETGRSRGIIREYGISRLVFRQKSDAGMIEGVRRAS